MTEVRGESANWFNQQQEAQTKKTCYKLGMQKAVCETRNLEGDGRQLQETHRECHSATPVSRGQEVKAVIPTGGIENGCLVSWVTVFSITFD